MVGIHRWVVGIHSGGGLRDGWRDRVLAEWVAAVRRKRMPHTVILVVRVDQATVSKSNMFIDNDRVLEGQMPNMRTDIWYTLITSLQRDTLRAQCNVNRYDETRHGRETRVHISMR